MSLRDALLAKGLVDDKRARRLDREAKAERKAKQGNRARRREEEAAADAAEAARDEERRAQAQADRTTAAQARDLHEHAHRVRRIVLDNRLGGRGPIVFFHRIGTSARIGRLQLPEALARDLRVGRAAIAALPRDGGGWDHHVVGERGARKLLEVAPETLVHWVDDERGTLDPSEVLLPPLGEPSLRPHRVRAPDTP